MVGRVPLHITLFLRTTPPSVECNESSVETKICPRTQRVTYRWSLPHKNGASPTLLSLCTIYFLLFASARLTYLVIGSISDFGTRNEIVCVSSLYWLLRPALVLLPPCSICFIVSFIKFNFCYIKCFFPCLPN